MVCKAGWTGRAPSQGLHSSPAAHATQHLFCFLLLLCAVLSAAEQPMCDMSPFTEQTPEGVPPCKTCFFPTYPVIESLDLSKYKPVDFTNQWIYFAGDSTLRQVYGEFYGIIHRTQVRTLMLLMQILACVTSAFHVLFSLTTSVQREQASRESKGILLLISCMGACH